ncbi:hypothetical protein [Rhodopila sp.]|uniref:hypothetical protein n=1 Tax=Rhodopila sp. TaxID=2480087 RepID=UPI003D15188F
MRFFLGQPVIFIDFDPVEAANDHFWFGLLNRAATMDSFFLLSDFVLTHRALVAAGGVASARAAVKR